MDLEKSQYVIGIDLGTTNSAVSYAALTADNTSDEVAGTEIEKTSVQQKKSRIKIFKVPQLTGPGEIGKLPVLPSFLYIPGGYDISKEAIIFPWDNENDNFSGLFARDHGAKVPARLVSSAKSWLCHDNVDRNAKILPWGSGDEVFKVSPIEATAAYLNHIKKAWNLSKGDEEELYLENQMIIITVPASFDEVARDLTVEAAAIAGLRNVTLLEEPLAAFYSWLIVHEQSWGQYVKEDELILVCDVGGGTTDFTLITLQNIDGNLRFERIAVGDHLILGGDNIDLALARVVEKNFGKNKPSLTGDRWKTLCHQCRQAKENILDGKSDSEKITLMGEGSKLIAGTVSATLTRQELEDTVLDGFFPFVDAKIAKKETNRKGITEFGLPYEQEPAMTKHLGWFLERHKEDVQQLLNKNAKPDLILFNGGSLKPGIIQEKIRGAIRHWFKEDDESLPRILENPDPDLSVSLGASYYGLVKAGEGVRVGSGSARGYYLGVSAKDDTNQTEKNNKAYAICLMERGLEEGSNIELSDKKFEVLTNQPVSFDVYSSSYRSGDRSGDLVDIDNSLTPLPPLQTIVQFGKKGVKTSIPVRILADYTEMGTLALWCRSLVSTHKWRLQFQLRDATAKPDVVDEEIFEESIVENACHEILSAFSDKTNNKQLISLSKNITDIIQRPKGKWPLGLIRNLSDTLLKVMDNRRLSPEYEIRWLNLMGYCMRPGFGDGLDAHRIKKIWKIYKQGPIFSKNLQVTIEWWIMWRRIAGGLSQGQQRQILQDLTPVILPKKGPQKKLQPQILIEIWMAVANMERLLVKDKIKWGRFFLSQLQPKKSKPQHFWTLSRIGARELLYGPADKVIPSNEISSWIEKILSKKWHDPNLVGNALVQMARKTGDRSRDLDLETINNIVSLMDKNNFPSSKIRTLKEVVPMEKQEESAIFGEDLPSGVVFHM